jgi:FlaA1/EpsC-like NDP-sugar epimerase
MKNDNKKSPSIKRKLPAIMALDGLLLPLSLWTAFALRFNSWWPGEIQELWWLFITAPLIAMPIFIRNGLYRAVLIYISSQAFFTIVKAVSLHVLVLLGIVLVVGLQNGFMTLFAIYWLVALTLVGGSRAILRAVLRWYTRTKNSSTDVVIYGAGEAGAELAEALQAGHEFTPIAFIDDKRELQATEIRGLKVYPTQELETLIKNCGVKQVLLAIPSARRSRRQQVVDYLQTLRVHVRTVPSLMDIVSGRSKVADLREVGIEDILGREPVPPIDHLLSSCITGKSVMVTGAGGSIGSELCRQIINLKPTCIVLFEASEYALYCIEKELQGYCKKYCVELYDKNIIPILGTVTNQHKVEYVLKTYAVQTLYHAAAYKHVPLVEYNPIEGVKNNIFGTFYTARAALKANIETFILISTDKAVRPTNVMGATKRMAELVVQGLARQQDTTQFSIVRFGNVLGSSGSVVPLFRQQIQNGGPITLTHPDITRYFMTIPEAAQLVIQAGSMGRGGDVFVLDMGEPVRIQDMARHMIYLCGLTVRDENNPDGDISIETTHLRPGEKLYEELLLGDNVTGTEHPRIMRAQEVELPWDQLISVLEQLGAICESDDSAALLKFLEEVVDGYSAQHDVEDPVWVATHQADTKKHTFTVVK